MIRLLIRLSRVPYGPKASPQISLMKQSFWARTFGSEASRDQWTPLSGGLAVTSRRDR